MNDQIQLIELWEKVLEKLQPTITPLVYNTWFKTVLPLQIVDNTFEIGVQKQFIQEQDQLPCSFCLELVELAFIHICKVKAHNSVQRPNTLGGLCSTCWNAIRAFPYMFKYTPMLHCVYCTGFDF